MQPPFSTNDIMETLRKHRYVKATYVAAARARVPLMLLITSLAFFIFPLLLLRSGLHGIRAIVGSEILSARSELEAIQHFNDLKIRAEQKFESLSTLTLPRVLFESHTECLVRGVHVVDSQIHFYEFIAAPAIGNKTVGWIKESCDKQFFTPQVLPSSPRLSQVFNARQLQRLRRRLAEMGDFLDIAVRHWIGTIRAMKPSATNETVAEAKKPLKEKISDQKALLKKILDEYTYELPPYFKLEGRQSHPYKLSFSPLASWNQPSRIAQDLNSAYEMSLQIMRSLEDCELHFQQVFHFVDTVYDWIISSQALLCILWQTAELLHHDQPFMASFVSPNIAHYLMTQLTYGIFLEASALAARHFLDRLEEPFPSVAYMTLVVVGFFSLFIFTWAGSVPLVDGVQMLVVDFKSFMAELSSSGRNKVVKRDEDDEGTPLNYSHFGSQETGAVRSEVDWDVVETDA